MPATLSPNEREALRQTFDAVSSNGPLNVLTRERFVELASLECDQGTVVSLYVDLSPQNRHNNAWAIELKTQVRRALAEGAGGKEGARVEEEVSRMERWLRDNASAMGRGAALFSCPEKELWIQIPLPIKLPTRLRTGRRPYLRPLARIRDEHDVFGVVCLDKQRARLFVSQYGHIQEVADIFEDTPGHHKQGGWSQMRFQRHHEAHVMWHAGAVGQATALLLERFGARHLLVSGTPEVMAEYRAHLPRPASRLWTGEFAVELDAPLSDVARAILPLQRAAEAKAELETIGRLNDSVSSRRGVWGLSETLAAVREKRVMVLVVHDQYRETGKECVRCELLFEEQVAACGACSGPVDAVEDLVDAVLERSVTQEAELELVRSNEARRLLPPGQPIGAILRF